MNSIKDYKIGVDVGGTFTDLVLSVPNSPLIVSKVPSTPSDPSQAVLNALEVTAIKLNQTVPNILKKTSLFVHGTTVGTNTILEKKGANVGLVTSYGFRDSLEIRRGFRHDPWDHRTPYPDVLVPRYKRLPVKGRIDRDGKVVAKTSKKDLKNILNKFKSENVESIAVCLFNSYISNINEKGVLSFIEEFTDFDWVSISSNISPIIGEYERSSTVVLNAYVAPRTVNYLKILDKNLTSLGLETPVLLIQNNGGAISIRKINSQPATLLLSGPAAGVGTLNFLSSASKFKNLISMEIGGTSCDVILMSDSNASTTDHLIIDGYYLGLPSVDVHTVGAGGGTIAGVDKAGMLFVGPSGAGAKPGPACYNLGGKLPTITDAQLILGRLSPGSYADGSIQMNIDLARNSIKKFIAEKLGISIEDAAIGIIRLMNQKLLNAVQQISVQRGHNPSMFTLVAGGGAGPLHGVEVSKLLGCSQVYITKLSGAFCAMGMLNSDVKHEYFRVYFSSLEKVNFKEINKLFDLLKYEGIKILRDEGFSEQDMKFRFGYDLRYRGQQWDVSIILDKGYLNKKTIKLNFESEHKKLFGHIQSNGMIEITKIKLEAIGKVPKISKPTLKINKLKPEPFEKRKIWIDPKVKWYDTPIYNGSKLYRNNKIHGPAVINENTSTIFIGKGDLLEVDEIGNYLIKINKNIKK